jgi:hypothetical protein
MKLSAEWFAELTKAMSSPGEVADHDERRRLKRVQLTGRLPVSLVVHGERAPAAPIMVRDFSPRGIQIYYPEPLALGQQFIVELNGGKSAVTLLCTTLHCRRASNGLHCVGAEFTCTLPSKPNINAPNMNAVQRIRASMLE